MAIQYNFLAPIDQKFVIKVMILFLKMKYLQNDYIPTLGISYEGDGSPVSYANSGIHDSSSNYLSTYY